LEASEKQVSTGIKKDAVAKLSTKADCYKSIEISIEQ
jgi:hypothetical protein